MSQRECLKENGEDHRISLWLQFEKAVNEVLGELCDILIPLFGVGVWVLELSLGNVGDGLHIIITKEGRHARQPGGRTQALAGTYTGHTFMRRLISISSAAWFTRGTETGSGVYQCVVYLAIPCLIGQLSLYPWKKCLCKSSRPSNLVHHELLYSFPKEGT